MANQGLQKQTKLHYIEETSKDKCQPFVCQVKHRKLQQIFFSEYHDRKYRREKNVHVW